MRFSHHLLPFGAEVQSNGQTRFRLWAPDAKRVELIVVGAHDRFALQRQDGGWFETQAIGL